MSDPGTAAGDRAPWVVRFHMGDVSVRGAGRFEVRRGRGRVARILGALLRLPRPGTGVRVSATIIRDGPRELWMRTFGERSYRSTHERRGPWVLERIGPLELRYRVLVQRDRIQFCQQRAGLRAGRLRVGLPPWASPQVRAQAAGQGPGPFFVRVEVSAPLVGLVLAYWGYLTEEA